MLFKNNYLTQKYNESPETFIQRCISQEIAYDDVLHEFNRRVVTVENPVLTKLVRNYGREGVPYMLKIFSETTQIQSYLPNVSEFLRCLGKNEGADYFRQLWPECRNKWWDNIDKMYDNISYQNNGNTDSVLKYLTSVFKGHENLAEDYILSRMVPRRIFDGVEIDDNLKALLSSHDVFKRVRWVLNLETPTKEEDIQWLERFNILGFDFAESRPNNQISELPHAMSL